MDYLFISSCWSGKREGKQRGNKKNVHCVITPEMLLDQDEDN